MNIHDWTLRASTHERPPCVLRHMGNAYAVAHIFTHTLPFTIETAAIQFSAVWPTLTYATQWRIHKFLYSQYNRPMVGILAVAQVGHCLSAAFGSHRRREGQTPSAD